MTGMNTMTREQTIEGVLLQEIPRELLTALPGGIGEVVASVLETVAPEASGDRLEELTRRCARALRLRKENPRCLAGMTQAGES